MLDSGSPSSSIETAELIERSGSGLISMCSFRRDDRHNERSSEPSLTELG